MSRHIVIHVFVLIITETTIVIKKSYQNPNDKTKYRTDNYGRNTKELLYAEYPKYQPKEKGTDSAIYKNGQYIFREYALVGYLLNSGANIAPR